MSPVHVHLVIRWTQCTVLTGPLSCDSATDYLEPSLSHYSIVLDVLLSDSSCSSR